MDYQTMVAMGLDGGGPLKLILCGRVEESDV